MKIHLIQRIGSIIEITDSLLPGERIVLYVHVHVHLIFHTLLPIAGLGMQSSEHAAQQNSQSVPYSHVLLHFLKASNINRLFFSTKDTKSTIFFIHERHEIFFYLFFFVYFVIFVVKDYFFSTKGTKFFSTKGAKYYTLYYHLQNPKL